MKHSILDKIFLGFLLLTMGVFFLLIVYSTTNTKKSLVADKTKVLLNEASLIGGLAINEYTTGNKTAEELQVSLGYFSKTLDASIWYLNTDGVVKAFASVEGHPGNPKNIHYIDYEFDTSKLQTFNGDFYGTFDDSVISVAVPLETKGEPVGMLILHSTTSNLNSIQSQLLQSMYVPFLVMIIISFILLGLISNKIMRPIKKINAVAEEYSTGNFDVKINVSSDDEIGQLASTLEYMASEISKLDEYRKDFISNISHDFRSPLTSIKGYAEAMQDGTIPPEKHSRYLDIIIHETNRLSKLTAGLLQLNDVDSYGLWLVFKNFDIVTLTKNAIDTFEGKCVKKNITLMLNNHCEHSIVQADKTKIQQVIYNLIDNAIKFTPEGKSIYVTLTERNDKIYVSVKDEGCGIPKESLKKIWVRFYKADTSRGKDKQGTGLGLAITKEIIKAHNESITVVSTEDVGSEFTFSIARADTDKISPTEELTTQR